MTHLVAAFVTLAITGRANATPSVAALDQFVAVVWGATRPAGGTDVYSAISRDGGRTFQIPVRVNDVEVDASLGLEQPPRIALVARKNGEPTIVIVWTAKTKDGTRLLVARSENGGASFTRAATFAGSEAPGNRGWASTTVDRQGHVVAVWLDHRDMAAGHNHSPSGAKTDGAAHAQASKLYFANLDD